MANPADPVQGVWAGKRGALGIEARMELWAGILVLPVLQG